MCPSWSPDGSAIAFHKFIANQIFVLSIVTGEERQLTSGPDLNQCPMWSPDGAQIAFFRIPTFAPDGYPLFVMRANGTNATRLGKVNFMADRGSWSPDGRWIAASRYPDDQIVLVNAQTGDAGLTLTSGSGGRAPSWAPDGSRITFMSWKAGSAAIYVMRANGTDVRQVTPSYVGAPEFADQYPVWTLDGRMITFHRYRPSKVPGIPLATLHAIELDGADVSWPAGEAADGDLPIWRPRP
jgi:TolB protein